MNRKKNHNKTKKENQVGKFTLARNDIQNYAWVFKI